MANKSQRDFQSSRKPAAIASIPPDLQSKFIDLDVRLSPENLTCDGECSRSEVKARLRAINREWHTLEAQAGRKVSQAEVDNWWLASIGTPGVSRAV